MVGCLNSPRYCAKELLPTATDHSARHINSIIVLSRLLNTNMKFFRFTFDRIIQFHIDHKYSKEMAAESNIVSVHGYMRE